MTLKRRAAKLKNKTKKKDAKYVILVGSENGGTLPFANAFQQQLLAAGEKVYITELNEYDKFKKPLIYIRGESYEQAYKPIGFIVSFSWCVKLGSSWPI